LERFSKKKIRHPNEPAKTPESLTDLIKEKIGTEGTWLLLDALDEVLEKDYRNAVVKKTKDFVGNNPDSRLLLTSRTTRYDNAFSDVIRQDETEREMELLPFEDEQIQEFARGYFGEEEAEEFLDELDNTAQIRGMAEVPLLLTFLCKIYESREDSGFQSVNRAQVYEKILDEILSATWHETERTSLNPGQKSSRLDELSAMAFTLLIQGEIQVTPRKLREAILFSYSKVWPEAPGEDKIVERKKEYTGKPGVLTRVGGKNTSEEQSPYLFVHLTIQEYLAAQWIALQANDNGWDAEIDTGDGRSFKISTIVNHKAWSPHWQQVILLLAGQLKDPVPLLELLADEERDDIFRNRLALAAHCLGEVMPRHS
jgi:predicted NACHT family NTPase